MPGLPCYDIFARDLHNSSSYICARAAIGLNAVAYVASFYSKSTAALDDVLRKAFARKCCVTEEHHYVALLVMLRQARAGLSALMTGAMAAVAAVQTSL